MSSLSGSISTLATKLKQHIVPEQPHASLQLKGHGPTPRKRTTEERSHQGLSFKGKERKSNQNSADREERRISSTSPKPAVSSLSNTETAFNTAVGITVNLENYVAHRRSSTAGSVASSATTGSGSSEDQRSSELECGHHTAEDEFSTMLADAAAEEAAAVEVAAGAEENGGEINADLPTDLDRMLMLGEVLEHP